MKILFILENYFPHTGGVETLFRNLAEGLAEKGHEVKILTHRLKNSAKNENINGVEINRVNCFDSRYLFAFFAIPKAIKLAKNADIIHTTTFTAAFPTYVASKFTKKPSLITIHEVWLNRWNYFTKNRLSAFIHNFLEKLIYFLDFNKFVCVSKATLNSFLSSPISEKKKAKATYVYDGFDHSLYNPNLYGKDYYKKKLNLQKSFILLSWGRPGISKGFEYLIKAFPLIKQKITNAKLVLMLSHDKAYRKNYKRLIKLIEKTDIKDEVIIINPLPTKEKIKLILSADCVVIPSLSEGFGYNIVEACSLGVPVVASNTASIPEVIFGKYQLVQPKDKNSIADGVEKIYKKQYQTSKTKFFTVEDNINGYLKIYDELVKK